MHIGAKQALVEVESLRFRPFEDILAVGTGAGASTAVIPGPSAGKPGMHRSR